LFNSKAHSAYARDGLFLCISGMEITVYNHSNLPVCDFEKFVEMQEDFKIEVPEKTLKLKNIIIERGFKYPFVCWVDKEGTKFIVDAHRRKIVLDQLRGEGWKIPHVPYYKIQAETKKEAVEEILLFNSRYSEINPETGLFEMYKIDVENLPIDIPEIKINTETPKINYQDEKEMDYKSQYGVIVICTDETEQQKIFEKLSGEGYECKVVVT